MLTAFIIIVIHNFADFVLQDSEWAVNKSKSNYALLKHTSVYSVTWLLLIVFLFPDNWDINQYLIGSILFVAITFIIHTITDYITSRHASKQYAKGNLGGSIPRGLDFFVTISLDQVLHYAQLFLTYHYICEFLNQ
jgi:hypothetical protein